MKKMKLLLGFALALPLLGLSPVFAESTTTNTTTPASTPASSPVATTDTSAQSATELKKRLDANKALLKTKLDDATSKRLVLKCKASQIVIETHGKVVSTIGEARGKAYADIVTKIQAIIDKLKANGKDTTEVEADLKVLQTKITTVSDDIKTYQQTITDLKAMDCVADPTAFQATILQARTQREAIRTAANDLHTYLHDTLRPAIEKLRPAETTTSTAPVNGDAALTSKVPATGGTR